MPPRVFRVEKDVLTNPLWGTTHPLRSKLVNGLQGIRRRLLDCQISSNITDVIINSWRPGTQKQYSVYVNRWTQFCDERQIHSISPSVTHVLEFLQTLYERDLSYSTINRAALNCYWITNSTIPLTLFLRILS